MYCVIAVATPPPNDGEYSTFFMFYSSKQRQ